MVGRAGVDTGMLAVAKLAALIDHGRLRGRPGAPDWWD
jgi:hypothetical protein